MKNGNRIQEKILLLILFILAVQAGILTGYLTEHDLSGYREDQDCTSEQANDK